MEASRRISASCLWTISSLLEMNFFIFETSFRVVSYLRVETVTTRPRLAHATCRRSDDHEDGVTVASRRVDAIFTKFKLRNRTALDAESALLVDLLVRETYFDERRVLATDLLLELA